ncbi:unnamed protein product [Cyprideis torosa]|uniref:Uncharacterized protein n=1 Tax=Cyprideis torosa TaxID=163714 RepID=A0A7R8W0L4_9CRUS|nr:unnamed protein product [Cyprideis torosa]CAG0879873.1 unnamed protein product [Cyprideis torosa]
MWIEGWPDICLLLALITSSMLPRTTAATLYQPGETVCLLTPDIRELLKDLSESASLAGQHRSKRAATRDMLGSQSKAAPQTYFGIQFDANGTASRAECTVGSTAVVVLELRSKRWNPSMGDVTSLHFVDLETKMKNSVRPAILDIQFVKERSVDDLDRAFRSKTQKGRKLGAYDLGEIIGWAVLPRGKGSATLREYEECSKSSPTGEGKRDSP